MRGRRYGWGDGREGAAAVYLANVVVALAIVAYIVSPYAGLAAPALGRACLMIVTTLLYA